MSLKIKLVHHERFLKRKKANKKIIYYTLLEKFNNILSIFVPTIDKMSQLGYNTSIEN